MICVNDEHPEKAPLLISVTEEGIMICLINEIIENSQKVKKF